MCAAKGSDVRPGVPWVSASFAWQAWDNVHCQGVGCTPWRPLGLRLFCVAGVAQCALQRGRMYALASLGSPPLLRGRRGTMCAAKGSDVRPGVPWVSASFAWQACHNVHCQGVGCTPWRPLHLRLFCVAGVAPCALPRARMYALASLGSPPLLRGRRGTMSIAKGSDARRGVPWVSASFPWQAWHNVHCQGVGCTRWRPLGLRLFCVAGVAQCALPRGRMYALASRGSRPVLRGKRGTMCTAKGSDVRPGVPWVSASFAWQAWRNVVHCQGVGCTPWRPLGLRLFCVAGVAQCALPRGRMYALASLRSPPLLRGRRGTMCTAKGSDVRPGVPWVSASFAWQAWHNVHCQGVGCTPWRPLGLRLFCVAGVGQCALPRGRLYALASLGSPPLLRGRRGTMCAAKGSDVRPGVPWVSASFAWQAWHNVHCQGVGCTPWRPLHLRLFCVALASLGSPPLLRGRRGTMSIAKGSDARPGVPWVSASFPWQAWHNVHCQGVGCTPWRPLGLRLFCVAGVAQCALPRGRMYALASRGSPPVLRGRRGTMCTAKGSDVRPGVPWVSASFAWQAWRNVHCQGVGCTPWRPLGLRLSCVAHIVAQCALPRGRMYALASPGSPSLLRGRRGTMCTAKGSDVRPGVPWVSVSFEWQAWRNVHCQGVGCTPWRPLGLRLFCVAGVAQCALPRGRMYALASLGSPPLLRGRRGTMCTAKGSDVRPGVPWVSASFAWQAWDNVHCQGLGCTPWRPLGLRLFCVAGVAQCALPRGRMYALASLGSPPLLRGRRGTMCTAKGSDVRPGVPWVSASFAWQAWHNVHCQGVGCTPWRPLGLRLFCVAGVGQCALPRARMYALASLGSPPLLRGRRGTMCTAKGSDVRRGVPWVSASFAWQAWHNARCQCTPWRPLGLRLF